MELSLVEKFLVLAQHPEKGKFIISGIHIQYGIIGALLLEMSIEDRIDLQNNILKLKTAKTHHNKMIAEIETQIRSATRPKKITRWMNKLSRKSKTFKKIIMGQLVRKNIIRIEQKSFLGLIPYKLHYLVNRKLRTELVRHLKTAILSNKPIANEDIVILGLIEACKMQKILSSDKAELKTIKARLKKIIKESPIAETVGKTIQQVQAAILIGIVASTAATSGGSH